MRRLRDSAGKFSCATLAGSLRLIGCVLLLATPASAQAFDGERFVPATGAAGGLQIERPVVPSHLGYGLGLFLNYADDPVSARQRETGALIGKPLDHGFSA